MAIPINRMKKTMEDVVMELYMMLLIMKQECQALPEMKQNEAYGTPWAKMIQ